MLLEGLVLLIPCAQLGGGLREGKAYGEGDFGGDQHEKDQALSPDRATAFFIAELVEMGERLGRFGAFIVRIVNDKAPSVQTIVAQNDPHTRHQELVPGHRAVAKHPGESSQRRTAEAGTCKACPAERVGYQNGGDTKREPGTLHGGHAVARTLRAHRLVNGVDKGAHKGCRGSKHQSGPHGPAEE